jgi:hypothetical protein
VRRKVFLGILVSVLTVFSLTSPAFANVIPSNPRVGTKAITRQWCFQGTVTFTIVGNGVSVVVGTAVASGPNGEAVLEFTVPDVIKGAYTMVGTGLGCSDGKPAEVRVGFTILPKLGGGDPPDYPPRGCRVDMDRAIVEVGTRNRAIAHCFHGRVRFSFHHSRDNLVAQPFGLASIDTELGTVDTDASGMATLEFTVPVVPNGVYEVTATGVDDTGAAAAATSVLSVTTTKSATDPAVITTTTASPLVTATLPAEGPVDRRVTAAAATTPVTDNAVPVKVLGSVETKPSSGAQGFLARTGSDAAGLLRLAVVVIAIGGVLVLATSRRRSTR